jgi:hypothetical protein
MSANNGASLGIVSVEVDGADPQPGVDVGALSHDLVMHGAGLGMPGSTAPGDAIPAPWALGQLDSSCRVPQLFAPIYRLETGGGQCGVHILTGHCREEVAVRNAGLGQLKHLACDFG